MWSKMLVKSSKEAFLLLLEYTLHNPIHKVKLRNSILLFPKMKSGRSKYELNLYISNTYFSFLFLYSRHINMALNYYHMLRHYSLMILTLHRDLLLLNFLNPYTNPFLKSSHQYLTITMWAPNFWNSIFKKSYVFLTCLFLNEII